MANLIITVIAIALVAVAAFMGAYYGGSAYLNNIASADAAVALTQAEQIKGAWQNYQAEHLNQSPAAYSDLISNQYLRQPPIVPPISSGTTDQTMGMAQVGSNYFAYADMGDPSVDTLGRACLQVIKTATGVLDSVIGPAISFGSIYNSSINGNLSFGCAISTGTTPTALGGNVATGGFIPPSGHYVMEYLLQ